MVIRLRVVLQGHLSGWCSLVHSPRAQTLLLAGFSDKDGLLSSFARRGCDVIVHPMCDSSYILKADRSSVAPSSVSSSLLTVQTMASQ